MTRDEAARGLRLVKGRIARHERAMVKAEQLGQRERADEHRAFIALAYSQARALNRYLLAQGSLLG